MTVVRNEGLMYNSYTSPTGSGKTLSTYREYQQDISKQPTVKRQKPVDLFAGSTAFVHSTTTIKRGYANWTEFDVNYQHVVDTYILGGLDPIGRPDFSQLFGGRLRAKIKSQNLNLAQSCAEYRQTCSMFAGLARDAIKTFRSLRNGRAFADFVRCLQQPRNRHERDLANRWLQYQYGVKPLMSDIYGVASALAARVRAGVPVYVRSSESGNRQSREKFSNPDLSRSWDISWNAKAKGRYLIRDAQLKELAQMGITNPLLLAWELVPYSFVVDWMFPVGKFLSSLDALAGTTGIHWIHGIKYHVICTYGYKNGRSTHDYLETLRFIGGSNLPLPKLGYQPSSSLTSVLNGLALLTQIRTGR